MPVPLPVLLCDPPGGFLGSVQLFKPLFLFLLINIQEKFDDDHPVIAQLLFKGQDVLIGALQLVLGRQSVKPVHLHAAVPASVKYGNPAVGRGLGPVTPEEGTHLLILSGPVAGIHVKSSWVQGLDQPVDLDPLAGCSHALKHNHDRNPRCLALPLQQPQFPGGLIHHPAVRFLIHGFI